MTGENIGKKPESTIAWPAGCDIDASARSDGPVAALSASSLISTLPSPVVLTSSIKDIESCGLGFKCFLVFELCIQRMMLHHVHPKDQNAPAE